MHDLTAWDNASVNRFGNLLSHDLETIVSLDKKTRALVEIIVSESPVKGYRALRDITNGEWLMSAFGILIGHQTELYSIQQSMEVHIETFEYGGKHLRHSCDGNLVVHSNERGMTEFYAVRDIKKEEEINYSYALTEFIWSDIAVERNAVCNCGTSKCEGVIKSFDMLTPAEQKEFIEKNIVSRYLANWFKEQQRLNSHYGK